MREKKLENKIGNEFEINISPSPLFPSSPRDESCLQFLTGLAGRIETFNFDALGDNHLNNQQ